ncbi:carbohydrate-binding protein [Plantactinospora sonchi]|uniref:Heavy metal-binding domain-containing protein n=1 Tax=Plantactinospora sonchi TaxID=1544735 RepID=A0ABU7S387_9ACTN
MNTAIKLGGFVLGLAGVFGAAYGAGQLSGPVRTTADAHQSDSAHESDSAHRGGAPAPSDPTAGSRPPGGLLVSERGYTLSPAPAAAGEFAFRIIGPDGRPVTDYDVAHDQRMHLIVARRDLSGYRHVHPAMDPDGTWRITSPLTTPGSWRAFADFAPSAAEPLTLGVDLSVPGDYQPRPLPPAAPTASTDGYTVRLDGTLTPGRTSRLSMTVSRDGRPVTDLQPYLGAYGHLVALRDGDLAYLHVHPEGTPGDGKTPAGPGITFSVEVPSAGTYRLYLDFRHAGTVRTAEFTLTAARPAGTVPPAPEQAPSPAPEPTASPDTGAGGTSGHGHD